jgi:RIO-like serine/threonine protein kinase
MKLSNLFESVEISEVGNSNALKEMLKRYGFSRIGHGKHSDVFCRQGDNYVLKINTPPIDIAYLTFVKYVESKNGKNPHLPKMSKIRWFGKGKDKFFMIPIEKLEPMPTNELADIIHVWLGYYTQGKELTPELQKQIAPYENLTKTIIDIDENLVGGGIVLDFNNHNFMLRNGKTVVLTDPVADMNSR